LGAQIITQADRCIERHRRRTCRRDGVLTCGRSRRRVPTGKDLMSQAEVHDSDLPIVPYHYVLGFKVAMDDAHLVSCLETPAGRHEETERLCPMARFAT